MKSDRTPGSVALEIRKSSSIIPGKSPFTADAVTTISLPPAPPDEDVPGPVNAYVNVGSSPSPCTQMLSVAVPESGRVIVSGEP